LRGRATSGEKLHRWQQFSGTRLQRGTSARSLYGRRNRSFESERRGTPARGRFAERNKRGGLVPPRCYEMSIVAGSFRVRTVDASGQRHRRPRAYLPLTVFASLSRALCFPAHTPQLTRCRFPDFRRRPSLPFLNTSFTTRRIALRRTRTRTHARFVSLINSAASCVSAARLVRSYLTNEVGLSPPVKLDLAGSRKPHGGLSEGGLMRPR
jgi:hypothetical protein